MNLEKFQKVRVIVDRNLDHPVVDEERKESWLEYHHGEEDPGEEDDQARDEGVDAPVVVAWQLEMLLLR